MDGLSDGFDVLYQPDLLTKYCYPRYNKDADYEPEDEVLAGLPLGGLIIS